MPLPGVESPRRLGDPARVIVAREARRRSGWPRPSSPSSRVPRHATAPSCRRPEACSTALACDPTGCCMRPHRDRLVPLGVGQVSCAAGVGWRRRGSTSCGAPRMTRRGLIVAAGARWRCGGERSATSSAPASDRSTTHLTPVPDFDDLLPWWRWRCWPPERPVAGRRALFALPTPGCRRPGRYSRARRLYHGFTQPRSGDRRVDGDDAAPAAS